MKLNTKQLVAIWYSGLLVALILLSSKQGWGLALAILIVGALFVLSFYPNANVRGRILAAWVIIPFVLYGLLLGGVAAYKATSVSSRSSLSQYVGTALPQEQIAQLHATAKISDIGFLEVSLFNSTKWNIQSLKIGLRVIDDLNGHRSHVRQYSITPAYGSNEGAPYKTTKYEDRLGYTLTLGEHLKWWIISASGYPPVAK